MRSKSAKGILALVTLLILLGGGVAGYFLLYLPYEETLALRREQTCVEAVTVYGAKVAAPTNPRAMLVPDTRYGEPKSNYDETRKICLGSFSSLLSYTVAETTTTISSQSVRNVDTSEIVLESVVKIVASDGSATQEVLRGVPAEEFKAQEEVLMSL